MLVWAGIDIKYCTYSKKSNISLVSKLSNISRQIKVIKLGSLPEVFRKGAFLLFAIVNYRFVAYRLV